MALTYRQGLCEFIPNGRVCSSKTIRDVRKHIAELVMDHLGLDLSLPQTSANLWFSGETTHLGSTVGSIPCLGRGFQCWIQTVAGKVGCTEVVAKW